PHPSLGYATLDPRRPRRVPGAPRPPRTASGPPPRGIGGGRPGRARRPTGQPMPARLRRCGRGEPRGRGVPPIPERGDCGRVGGAGDSAVPASRSLLRPEGRDDSPPRGGDRPARLRDEGNRGPPRLGTRWGPAGSDGPTPGRPPAVPGTPAFRGTRRHIGRIPHGCSPLRRRGDLCGPFGRRTPDDEDGGPLRRPLPQERPVRRPVD